MPTNEKEININLFDKLEMLERIEAIAKEGNMDEVLKQLEREKKWIERKLYQNPSLTQPSGQNQP